MKTSLISLFLVLALLMAACAAPAAAPSPSADAAATETSETETETTTESTSETEAGGDLLADILSRGVLRISTDNEKSQVQSLDELTALLKEAQTVPVKVGSFSNGFGGVYKLPAGNELPFYVFTVNGKRYFAEPIPSVNGEAVNEDIATIIQKAH